MKRSDVNTTVAVLVAAGVVLAGCAEDDDGTTTGVATAVTLDDAAEGIDDRGVDRDADGGLAGASRPPIAEADVAAEELIAATTVVPAIEAGAAGADAEGGLFGADRPPPDPGRQRGNTFEDYGYRDFVSAATDPVSTFALDVDTGSYAVARRWLEEGVLPPRESVRPEEYVNAFTYDYDAPRRGLDLTIDGGPSPFDDDRHLVRVGVQGEIVDDRHRGPAALTFVVDTSGSMDRDDRLGLVKDSLTILVDELDADDTVAIVTYDDDSGVVLEPTEIADREEVVEAIDRLRPGGSTNLEAGLRKGYALAAEAFRRDGINRVVLASDGVANVGVTDADELSRMIRDDAERGIDLVTVGFGMGNFDDVTMEQLADRGNGFYAYVDTIHEAERLFEDELTSTLLTVAEDAKIQVEFDPEIVDAYRLIGFENRGVLDRDFRDDDVDAGEIGAGHQVTALYDVELRRGVDLDDGGAVGEVRLRWQVPGDGEVVEIHDDIHLRDIEERWSDSPADLQLATVVAVFAEILRENPHAGFDHTAFPDLLEEAERLADDVNDRDVDELVEMIERAAELR